MRAIMCSPFGWLEERKWHWMGVLRVTSALIGSYALIGS